MLRLRFSDRLSTALILGLIALAVALSGVLSRLDNVLADVGQRLARKAAPADLVIVAIDETSLAALGRWPWSRRLHASLLDRLVADGAHVIALDLVFAEPDAADPPADALLAAAVARAGNVVLPVLLEANRANGALIETLPLPQLVAEAAALGRVHVELDADGIARAVYLWEGVGTPVWPHFAQAVIDVQHGTVSRPPPPLSASADPYALVRRDLRRVRFLGPPGHLASLSYVQVLAGEFAPGTFRGKTVLVGATAAGLGDVLPTPVSGQAQPMPGVEFHANALHTLRSGQAIRIATTVPVLAANLALALLPLLWLARLGPLSGLLACLAAFVAAATLALALPLWVGWQVSLAGGLLAVLLAYPVWSWRRLDAATRFLDYELGQLRAELGQAAPPPTVSEDRFAGRIAEVRAASDALKSLLDTRAETLAFISHDLRAPIAQARLQLGERAPDVAAALERAHRLAEDFLHASRADMLDAARFEELDFAAVVHQAADDAWAVAQAKSLALSRRIPDTPCWLRGDFGLLHRAVLNLVLNAIKHAPGESAVEVRLAATSTGFILAVSDQGAGIAAADLEKLGAAGATLAAGARAGGAGLGLYFVRTVAQRHGGQLVIESEPGVRTVFSLVLPTSNRHSATPH